MQALSDRCRVIAPDIHGFGLSQPPRPWTLETMADDLNALLDSLSVADIAVVGVSLGGYIALAFWSKYPSRVRQLVLSNSRARADNETEKAARTEMIAAIQQSGGATLADRMLPRLLQPNPQPAVVREVRKMVDEAHPMATAYALMAMRDRLDYSTMLHRIACPALIIAGEKDAIIRVEDSEAVAEAIPGARFVTIQHSGHLSNMENPQSYNDVLVRFLL